MKIDSIRRYQGAVVVESLFALTSVILILTMKYGLIARVLSQAIWIETSRCVDREIRRYQKNHHIPRAYRQLELKKCQWFKHLNIIKTRIGVRKNRRQNTKMIKRSEVKIEITVYLFNQLILKNNRIFVLTN